MLYKRPNSPYWYAKFRVKGKGICRSTQQVDRQKAQEIHDRWKAQAWEEVYNPKRPDYSWGDACVKWEQEKRTKKSIKRDIEIIKDVHRFLGNKMLSEITRPLLEEILLTWSKESSQATADRKMALVRSILRRARMVWGWVDEIPHAPMFNVDNERVRNLTDAELGRLYRELPDHLEACARMGVSTGLRSANIKGMLWEWIDPGVTQVKIPKEFTKNKQHLSIPLNADAQRVIKEQIGKHETHVFTWRKHTRRGDQNLPIKGGLTTKAWRAACQRAGIEDFHFHDTRHCWASRMREACVPLDIIQELGGWRDGKMVQRYGHLNVDHLRQFAEKIEVSPPVEKGAGHLQLVG